MKLEERLALMAWLNGLHESLPVMSATICRRTVLNDITLDSSIVSATPLDDLRTRYDGGGWNRKKFTDAHILFLEFANGYNYILLKECTC